MNRLFLVLIGFAAGSLAQAAPTHDDSFTKAGLFKADANKLTDTQLVVGTEVPLDPAKNVLWCGTLQLAWNELAGFVGEKPRFVPHSLAVDLLNSSSFTRADLDPSSYVAIADFEHNHVEDEIRAALQKKFGGDASPELIPPTPPDPGGDDFVAYAYLYKNLAFAHPFTAGTMSFAGKTVQSFVFPGKPDEKLTQQVQVEDYRSADNFIVSLQTKSPDDQLVLAKIPPKATLEATIHAVLDRLKSDAPEAASASDSFAVPKLNFDLRRHFHELEGLTLEPSPAAKIQSKLVITDAQQLVRFQLNEKGAVLKSEAVIILPGAMAMPRRLLVLDQPFLILLKQERALSLISRSGLGIPHCSFRRRGDCSGGL